MSHDLLSPETIFARAIEINSPEGRAAFLDRACRTDANLRGEVEKLVVDYFRAGKFLEKPAVCIAGTVDESISERPGTIIGPYKLLEQIGEGGFGVVFMAEQQAPIRRKVALKVLKPGMDTRQVIARFEAERQALALMDHPNIAKVLDAGETATGRPYFVMELVKGVMITGFCDEKQSSVRERLELLLHVCHAVQHAHQKGIIHRDIKPSNVLVTLHDGVPVPKVIDFGIVKAMGQQLTDKTLFTNFAQLIGTPLYMSPEQAELSGLDVDTRSDIYSLGVLLYELLTGTTPFDKDRLKTAGYDEMRRIIREEEPPKPSTRMSTLGQAGTTFSTQRKSDPKRLSQLFRGELDWIVMKALEKDRNRRYESAHSLAMDIERYLHDEPVHACPPSTWYRFRKMARRYRAALTTASLLLLVLLAGVGISAWEAIRARAKGEEAEANFRKACQAVDDQFTLISQSKLFEAPGFQDLRKELLESALKYYQEFLQQRPDDPELQVQVAAAYLRLYEMYPMMHGFVNEDAMQALTRGIEIVEKLLHEYSGDPELYRKLAGFGQGTRQLHRLSRNPYPHTSPEPSPSPIPPLERAVAIWEALVRKNPTELGFQFDLADFYDRIHYYRQDAGHYAEAFSSLGKAQAIRKKLVHENPRVPEYRAKLADTFDELPVCLGPAGRKKEIEECYRRSLSLRSELSKEFPRVPEYRALLADSHNNLGYWLSQTGKIQEAEKNYGEALKLCESLLKDIPNMPSYRSRLAFTHDSLGNLFRDTGRPDEAIPAYQQAMGIWEKLTEDFPAMVSYPVSLSFTCFSLGPLLAARGQQQQADQVYAKPLQFTGESADDLDLMSALLFLVPDPKFRDLNRALSLAQKALQVAPSDWNIWNTLGIIHYRLGNWKEAVEALQKSMDLLPVKYEFYNTPFLAMAYWKLGDKEQGRKWFAQTGQEIDRLPYLLLEHPREQRDRIRRDFLSQRAEAAQLLGIKDESLGKEKQISHTKATNRQQ
jgi:serine/threonine protein kinase/tetratricopeptide (TPR) repeat protein